MDPMTEQTMSRTGEQRRTAFTDTRIRIDADAAPEGKVRVGGLLVPWERDTTLADFGDYTVTERFEKDSIENADAMFYLVGHQRDRAVASFAAGNMVVEDRADARYVFADVDPDDPDARSLISKVRQRAVVGQSIGFSPLKERRIEHRADDGKLERVEYVIESARMIEASAVTWPAYTDTTLDFRARKAQFAEVQALAKGHDPKYVPPQRRARIARARLALSMTNPRRVG